MGFKDHVANDIKTIYTNIFEHAELTRVRYNTKRGKRIPVVFDHDGTVERTRTSTAVGRDNADDILIADKIVYIATSDLNTRPRRETNIEIADEVYRIVRADDEDGIFKIWLLMFDD